MCLPYSGLMKKKSFCQHGNPQMQAEAGRGHVRHAHCSTFRPFALTERRPERASYSKYFYPAEELTCTVTTQSSACVEMHSTKPVSLSVKIFGAVGSASVTDSTISSKRFCRTARISITLPWSNPLTTGIAWQMSLKSAVGCFALRIQAPSVKPHGMRVRKMDLIDRPC